MDILDTLPPYNEVVFDSLWLKSKQTESFMGHRHLPKITIVTPSFNQGSFIESTIRSVLLQGYPNLEYIIIDGGSTDETINIIKKYEKWLTYWVSEPDKGQSEAINKGLAVATGDVFNWLNSDDILAPNTLWNIGYYFLNHHQTDAYLGQLCTFCDYHSLSQPFGMTIKCNDSAFNMILSGMTQQALFYRLNAVKELGGVDNNLYYCMDLELWCRFLLKYGSQNIGQTQTVFAYFRVHQTAKSQSIFEPYDERRAVFLSMLKYLDLPKNLQEHLSYGSKYGRIEKTWSFQDTIIVEKKNIVAYIIEHLLVIPYFDYPLSMSYKSWVFSLYKKVLGRRFYFYTLPMRFIYRKIKHLFELSL